MHRTLRLTLASTGIAVLTACGTATPPAGPAPGESRASVATKTTNDPKPPKATTGAKLVAVDLSQLKSFEIDLHVPVVITTSADAGAEYHLGSRPDGSVDFAGTAVTETTRMRIEPAMVRKRTEKNRNHVVIVSAPAVTAAGPASCVTDGREFVLRMQACRPGDATQSWRLEPAGDSGLFELAGAYTTVRVDGGKLVAEGGWSALQTIAVAP